MIPAAWQQKGQLEKTLHQFPSFNMEHKKRRAGTACSTLWATPSAHNKQNDGKPATLQVVVPDIMKVIDPLPCREAGRILLMFQTRNADGE